MGYASPLMDLARVAVREAYGEPVTYVPLTGSPVACVGIHRREALVVLDGPSVDAWREVVSFREADLVNVTPRTNDTIVLGDVNYKVIAVERGVKGAVICTIGRKS